MYGIFVHVFMFYAWISVNHACFIATWCGRLMQILCRLCGAKVIIYSNICPYTSVSSIPCIKRTCISRKLMHGTHMDFQTHTYNRYIDCACIACTHTYYAQYMHGSTIPCTCVVNNLWPGNESACVCSSKISMFCEWHMTWINFKFWRCYVSLDLHMEVHIVSVLNPR